MQPHAFTAQFPGAADRVFQQVSSKPLPDKLGNQTKIADLCTAERLTFQFEVTDGRATFGGDPQFNTSGLKTGLPSSVGPDEPLIPDPGGAHREIEVAGELGQGFCHMMELVVAFGIRSFRLCRVSQFKVPDVYFFFHEKEMAAQASLVRNDDAKTIGDDLGAICHFADQVNDLIEEHDIDRIHVLLEGEQDIAQLTLRGI